MTKAHRFILLTALLFTGAALVQAQSGPVYARLGMWNIERAGWADFEAASEAHIKPVLDRLFDDGIIVEYGLDAADLHQEGHYSHEMWFSATSLANLARATDALVAMEQGLSDTDRNLLMGKVVGHEDSQVVSSVFRARSGSLTNGFSASTSETLKPAKAQAYLDWYRNNVQPVFEELMAAGHVTAFGLDAEQIHSGNINNRTSWYIVPTADGLDAVEEAFQRAFPPDKLARLLAEWADIVDPEKHRDSTSRVLFYRAR